MRCVFSVLAAWIALAPGLCRADTRLAVVASEDLAVAWRQALEVQLSGRAATLAQDRPTHMAGLIEDQDTTRVFVLEIGSGRRVSTPVSTMDPRTLALITETLLEELSARPTPSALLSAPSSVAQADGRDARRDEPCEAPPPPPPNIRPYLGGGIGAYGDIGKHDTDGAWGLFAIGGIGFGQWFRIELRLEGGTRTQHAADSIGIRQVQLAPFMRASAPLIASFPLDERWALHLATYPSLGLTNQRFDPDVPGRPQVDLNESVGWGNFLAATFEIESNTELWLRLDGEIVFSLGWGSHMLLGLSTALAFH